MYLKLKKNYVKKKKRLHFLKSSSGAYKKKQINFPTTKSLFGSITKKNIDVLMRTLRTEQEDTETDVYFSKYSLKVCNNYVET